jgi:hypothetical protein
VRNVNLHGFQCWYWGHHGQCWNSECLSHSKWWAAPPQPHHVPAVCA